MANYVKCLARQSVSFPHDFLEELKVEASQADTDVSKLILDIVFMARKGETHAEHKANFQRRHLEDQAKTLPQKRFTQ